jgi:hypothetical protein
MQIKRQYVLPVSTLMAIVALLAASSCKKTDIDFGGQYIDNGHTKIVLTDTITPLVSTVFVDSFSTVSTGVALVGTHTDPAFGKSAAANYFEFAPPTGVTYDAKATYDSIILVVKPNKSYYGDTTTDIHLGLYELNQFIVPVTTGVINYGTLYNTTSFERKPNMLNIGNVAKTFRFKPATTDTIAIRLNDAFGSNLFNLLKTNQESVQTTDKFINTLLKGLYLTGGAGDQLIIGLKDSITMRLYYTTPDLNPRKEYVTFNVANSAHQFNHIDIDRTGTVLGTAGFGRSKPQIFARDLGNTAFMQYITGSVVKLRFPTARASILNAPNYLSILSAQLSIKPVLNTYNGIYKTLPAALRLSSTDKNNLLGSDLGVYSGSSFQTQTGNLFIDYLDAKNTAYTYDLTSYLQQQISLSTINENGLLLAPPSPGHLTGFNRLIVGDNNNVNGQMKLTIHYLAIQ